MIGKTFLVTALAGVARATATPAEAAPKSACTGATLFNFVFAPTLVIINEQNYGSNNSSGNVVVTVNSPGSATTGAKPGEIKAFNFVFAPPVVIINPQNFGRGNSAGDIAVTVNSSTPSTAAAATRRNSARASRTGAQ
jgi:hypothetical protein